ncbi:MAG: hypothetical protein GEU98_09930 [Pseudonocardiaceae bacterium]|nr:hypothetical protein [Pseudonocardiaceae bacterium]
MSVMETVLIFVVIPLAIYGVLSAMTLRSKLGKAQRYRPGQKWNHPPQWWTANPAGVGEHRAHGSRGEQEGASAGAATTTATGGARGSW